MKKKKVAPPEQPDHRIWFMGFPDWRALVLTGLVLWASYDMGTLPW